MADINRGTTGIALPAKVSEEIWGATVEESFFMRAARQLRMPGTGVSINTITGEPEAGWVNETAPKPVSTSTFSKKTLVPYKLAVIEPFSNEFRRDLPGLYEELVRRLPYALAKKFDETIMGTTAPGTGFDVLGSATAVGIAGKTFKGMVAAMQGVAAAGGIMDKIGLSAQGMALVMGATDGNGRPLFVADASEGNVGRILGAEVMTSKALYKSGTPNILGIAGDFSDAVYGTVEGVQISVSDQATLTVGSGESATTLNLWQSNMFGVRAEIEVAFAVRSASEFAILTSTTQS